jgi:enamine deaminase RidA (YjgF/YER057c/UK114 family)
MFVDSLSSRSASSPLAVTNQAFKVNVNKNVIFTSGQIGLDAATGELVAKDFSKQAEQSLKNL